jgi:predicted PurR-regulated permease PerM
MGEQKLVPLVLLISLISFVLFKMGAILLPFGLAATIAYCLNPLVGMLQMQGIRRNRAVMVVYLALGILLVSFTFLGVSAAIQSAANFGIELPHYVTKMHGFVNDHIDIVQGLPWLSRWDIGPWLHQQLGQQYHSWLLAALQKAPTLVSVHLLPLVEVTLLVPFLVFFFMLDGPAFLDQLVDFVPARYVEMTLNVLVEIHYSLGNYLRGILIQACFMGFFAGVGYGLIGLHYAVYIALWVALTSVVPYFGPISAAIAGGLIALFQWGTLGSLLKVLVVYGGVRFCDDWLLQPIIMRKAVNIHPILLVFTLIAGGSLGGFWGLLFSVPIACMLKVLIQVGWQWYHTEYGTRPAILSAQVPDIPII